MIELVEVGDKYKGLVNGAKLTIISIDDKNKAVSYECNGRMHIVGLEMFKRLRLEKI